MMASIVALRAACGELFAWWLQELREARAAAAEMYAPVRSPRFQVQLSAEQGVLKRTGDASAEWRVFQMEHQQVPPLEQIWTGAKPSNARLDLVMPEAQVLVFDLQLPPMAEHDLKDAVELQLERKLPLPREQLYVDWIVTRKLSDRSRHIKVAAARRAHVDQWRDRFRPWGWRVARVTCPDADHDRRFNLLPRSSTRVSLAMGRREVLLAWSALSLIVCYGVVTGSQWIYERTSLATTIRDARTQVEKVRQLRAAFAAEAAPLAELKRLAELPSAASALALLSTSLPANSWLYQAEIHTAETDPVITMEGYTPSAASLVQALEQAQQFNSIQLIEASRADPASAANRVKLKLELRGGQQP